MNWIALKLPFDVKTGDIVMYSPTTGDLVQVTTPKNVEPKFIEKVPKISPLIVSDKVPPQSQFKKKTCVKRPGEKLKSDREHTLNLIMQHPAGIPCLEIAKIIHSRSPSSREKSFAVDDSKYLKRQGLIEMYNISNGTLLGQVCARPVK